MNPITQHTENFLISIERAGVRLEERAYYAVRDLFAHHAAAAAADSAPVSHPLSDAEIAALRDSSLGQSERAEAAALRAEAATSRAESAASRAESAAARSTDTN